MVVRILIDQLLPGMYVVSVARQTGDSVVLNEGLVRTDEAIAALRARGILEVLVDPSRSRVDIPASSIQPDSPAAGDADAGDADTGDARLPANTPAERPAADARNAGAKTSFEAEIGRAAKLYNEAKALQQKAFNDLKAGRPVAVGHMQDMAGAMMDSIFRNQDALLCMSRIREKDAYLLEHSVNVSLLMTLFGRHLQLDENLIHELATGALLHDIGKIRVPDSILMKPGKLTPEEFVEMRRHVDYGVDVLCETPGISATALATVAEHHERLSGNGYPHKLSGDQISRFGRMIAIVDSYDAITANRVYKEGNTSLRAFKILRDEAGSSFDGELVTAFIRAIGVHPTGTLVRLRSQRVGMVARSNSREPLKPVVKVFYNAKLRQYTKVADIDLADRRHDDEIEASIRPEEYQLDFPRFFRTVVIGA